MRIRNRLTISVALVVIAGYIFQASCFASDANITLKPTKWDLLEFEPLFFKLELRNNQEDTSTVDLRALCLTAKSPTGKTYSIPCMHLMLQTDQRLSFRLPSGGAVSYSCLLGELPVGRDSRDYPFNETGEWTISVAARSEEHGKNPGYPIRVTIPKDQNSRDARRFLAGKNVRSFYGGRHVDDKAYIALKKALYDFCWQYADTPYSKVFLREVFHALLTEREYRELAAVADKFAKVEDLTRWPEFVAELQAAETMIKEHDEENQSRQKEDEAAFEAWLLETYNLKISEIASKMEDYLTEYYLSKGSLENVGMNAPDQHARFRVEVDLPAAKALYNRLLVACPEQDEKPFIVDLLSPVQQRLSRSTAHADSSARSVTEEEVKQELSCRLQLKCPPDWPLTAFIAQLKIVLRRTQIILGDKVPDNVALPAGAVPTNECKAQDLLDIVLPKVGLGYQIRRVDGSFAVVIE